jgi:hypothetical protein
LSDQEFPDVGLHIDEAFVTLKLEQTTADHLQRIGVVELDQQRLEQEARLKRMQAQHEMELEALRTEHEQRVAEEREQHRRALEQERFNRYQKVLDDGLAGLIALRLARQPEDFDPLINMLQQEGERSANHEGVIKKVSSLPPSDGGMELALRLHFGEPGKHVALADSSKILAQLDSLWAHCANVVRPIDSDLPQEGVADTESPSAGSDIDTSVPPLQVRINHGSLLLELLQSGSDWWAVQAMAVTTFAIKVGPTLAGLPPKMQERWYVNKAAAERAKQDLIAIRGQLALEAPKSSSPSLESRDQETSGGQHA